MSDRDKLGTQVALDVTPVSLHCYDAGECSAVTVLRNTMPSVRIETNVDGTITATCPIRQFAQAQETIRVTCFGCRAHGIG
ncbi:MAG: hypothetical protein IKL95_00690 [Alphaproteobacteria bacterium]|nr:hypothetical protein [Alphaproteobacteria bacterium]